MKKTRMGLLLLVQFILLGSNSYEQNSKALDNTILWKITGKDIKEASYILLTTPTCNPHSVLGAKLYKVLESIKNIAIEDNINSKENAVKLKDLLVPKTDSQKFKNTLSATEVDDLIRKAKETNAINADANDFQIKLFINQYRSLYVLSLLYASANPCSTSSLEKIEDILADFSRKKSIAFEALFSPEEIFNEYDKYTKEFWRQNILYTGYNNVQVKSAITIKNNLYSTENMKALTAFLASNDYYKIKYQENNITIHNRVLIKKIITTIQKQPTLIAIGVVNYLLTNNSIYELLKKEGYTITPVF
ncbi:MAG: TraB/GumN family protein [Limnohabitans sp.]|nr:TraB/GumN family protein [Limnohabitans sp.]